MRVIYIDIDSMRPKHIGAHGYHRETTPNIDGIAERGVRFSRAYCASSPCVPSRASFSSGLFGIHTGVVTHWGPGSDYRMHNDPTDRPMFIRLLRRNGYKLATFSSFADRHDAFWYMAGWNEVHTHTLKKGGEEANEVIDSVLPWLETHGKEDNYFLHVQLWDPHRDYTVPTEYQEMFKDSPPPSWPDEKAIESHQDNYAPFSALNLFPLSKNKSNSPSIPNHIRNRDDFKAFVDAYDGSIRFMDEQLGRLFKKLEQLGVMEDTAIIISGDHGEAMGEHGIYGDHVCADEAVHNIPMIIKWPGVTQENVEHNDLVYNVDLTATITDMLGVSVPKKWDGQSFAGLLRGEGYQARDYLVWDHCLYSVSRTVRTNEWLLMRTYHPGVVPLEPLELYNMKEDPFMTENLAEQRQDVVKELDHLFQKWYHEQVTPSEQPDPLPLVIQSGPYKYVTKERLLDNLRTIGREELYEQFVENISGVRR
jgi:choline-sulfatase